MIKPPLSYWSLILGVFSLGMVSHLTAELAQPRAVIEINVFDEKTKKFVPNAAVTGTFTDEAGNTSPLTEKITDARGQYLDFVTVNGKFIVTVTATGYETASTEGEVKGTDVRVSRRIRKNVTLKRPAPAAPTQKSESTAPISPMKQMVPESVLPMTRDQILSETRWDEDSMHSAVLDAIFSQSSNLGWAVEKLKNSSESFRESFLRGLLEAVKAYISSENFTQDYFQRRREWYRIEDHEEDANYPKSVKTLLRKRLQWFMDETANVDFDAETENKDGLIVFVREEHERKPYLWKKCFRAGPHLTKIARDFVKDWLDSLKK